MRVRNRVSARVIGRLVWGMCLSMCVRFRLYVCLNIYVRQHALLAFVSRSGCGNALLLGCVLVGVYLPLPECICTSVMCN
jgi:hypothetical protein